MTTHLNRRGFLAAGAFAAGSLAAPGLLRAQAAKDIRLLFPGGTWKDWVEKTFVTPFAEQKQIEAVWKLGLGHEPLVMAQKARPQWDLIHTGQMRSGQLGAMGMYRKMDEALSPKLKGVHPAFKYEYLAGKTHTPYGLAVNTKEIKREIKSWRDLWDPAFKGKVAFPAWGWVGDEVFYAVNIAFGGTSENIDPGIEAFKKLFTEQGAIVANNVEHTRQLLDAGEVWLAPFFGGRIQQAAAAGTPVEFVIPEEGGLSWAWNMSVIEGRPEGSIELAYGLLDETFDPEKQIAFAKLNNYPPTAIEAMNNLPKELEHLKLSEDEVVRLSKLQAQVDPMVVFAYRDAYAERWNKEVLGA